MKEINYIISIIADETQASIRENFPAENKYQACPAVSLAEPHQVIRYPKVQHAYLVPRARQGAMLGVSNRHLMRLATRHNCLVRVVPRPGDYIIPGDPVLEVYGEAKLPPTRWLLTFFVAPERTLYQDPAYGFRELVDIASQALSPAVNAPTTATQVLDRLTALLADIAHRPPPSEYYADPAGVIRLARPIVPWAEYVDLAFSEIIEYGAASSQVRHSLDRAFAYLLANTPPDRHEPLLRQQQCFSAALGDEQRSRAPSWR